jgi:hypothetical protein
MRSYEYEYIVLNEEMTGSEDYEELSMKICVYRLSKENLLNSRQGYNRIAGNPGTVHPVMMGIEEATKSSYYE